MTRGARPISVDGTGGMPSLETRDRRSGDRGVADWVDAPGDRSVVVAGRRATCCARWIAFIRSRTSPEFAASWAEWLYFNGRTRDGRLRFYLTFLVGPASATPGRRVAGVRLQLERDGTIDELLGRRRRSTRRSVLAGAPDLDIAGNRVRLDGLALPDRRSRCRARPASSRSTPRRADRCRRRRFAARAAG